MAESWGNGVPAKYNEDLVSNPANHNILKVNDVNVNNDAKIALHTINSCTKANASIRASIRVIVSCFSIAISFSKMLLDDIECSMRVRRTG